MGETGDKLNAAYRALPRRPARRSMRRSSPRRAVRSKPSASRRWAAPVSIAAVLVLAFGVTLRMQQEKPGVESPEVYSSPPASARSRTPAPMPRRGPTTSRAGATAARRARSPGEEGHCPAAKPISSTAAAKLKAARPRSRRHSGKGAPASRRIARRKRAEGPAAERSQRQRSRGARLRPQPAAPPTASAARLHHLSRCRTHRARTGSRDAGEARSRRRDAAGADRRACARARSDREVARGEGREEGSRQGARANSTASAPTIAFPTPCGSA